VAENQQQAELMKNIQARLEHKVKEHEIQIIEYWKEQVDRLVSLKPEGVAALQAQTKKISEMMATRIRTLKREL
jgi:hypothetical protein